MSSCQYPPNWPEIAAAVKQAAGYRCNNCGLKCLPPNDSYKHLDLSMETPVTTTDLTSSACVVGVT